MKRKIVKTWTVGIATVVVGFTSCNHRPGNPSERPTQWGLQFVRRSTGVHRPLYRLRGRSEIIIPTPALPWGNTHPGPPKGREMEKRLGHYWQTTPTLEKEGINWHGKGGDELAWKRRGWVGLEKEGMSWLGKGGDELAWKRRGKSFFFIGKMRIFAASLWCVVHTRIPARKGKRNNNEKETSNKRHPYHIVLRRRVNRCAGAEIQAYDAPHRQHAVGTLSPQRHRYDVYHTSRNEMDGERAFQHLWCWRGDRREGTGQIV